MQLDLGNFTEARRHLDQALALREALVKDEPKNLRYQADLARSRLRAAVTAPGRPAGWPRRPGLWQEELGKLEAAERAGMNRVVTSGQLLGMGGGHRPQHYS